jgi:hypothetical protein
MMREAHFAQLLIFNGIREFLVTIALSALPKEKSVREDEESESSVRSSETEIARNVGRVLRSTGGMMILLGILYYEGMMMIGKKNDYKYQYIMDLLLRYFCDQQKVNYLQAKQKRPITPQIATREI